MKKINRLALLAIKDLGLVDYHAAYQIQQEIVSQVVGGGPDTLILCEHRPVFTLGRLAREDYILATEDVRRKCAAQVVRINRGGEVTFHGPGQVVAYPIFNLAYFRQDLKHYLSQLEEVAIDFIRYFGIVANRMDGQRGVFIGQKKIASVGIGVRKWVSFHGMAININTDLSFFAMIKPCGLDVVMTSLQQLLGRRVDMADAKEKLINCFCRHFDLELKNGV